MFILQKQLSVLNVPSSRVATIYRSGAEIQLALPGLPSQMGSAHLVMLKGGGKIQVLVGLFMSKSRCNIFYISDSGEVAADRAEQEIEAGQVFAESMGFILNDTEFQRLTAEEQKAYWRALPVCQRHAPLPEEPKETKAPSVGTSPEPDVVAPIATISRAAQEPASEKTLRAKASLQQKRQIFREHLGRFLASL